MEHLLNVSQWLRNAENALDEIDGYHAPWARITVDGVLSRDYRIGGSVTTGRFHYMFPVININVFSQISICQSKYSTQITCEEEEARIVLIKPGPKFTAMRKLIPSDVWRHCADIQQTKKDRRMLRQQQHGQHKQQHGQHKQQHGQHKRQNKRQYKQY